MMDGNPIITLPQGSFMSSVVIHVGKSIASLSIPAKLLFDLGCIEETAKSCRYFSSVELKYSSNDLTQALDVNAFMISLTGVRSWPRGSTCVLSMLSTQRAGTASCSASKRTRPGRWRPSRRAAGWN